MKNTFNYFIYALLFTPILGYFSFTYTGFSPIQLLSYSTLVLIFVFIITTREGIIIPKFLYFYFCYIIYIFIWRLYNGYIEDKGLDKYIFNNFHLYTALLIIIIYNVKIDELTFQNSIKIIKTILIIALIVSLIQLLINPNFYTRTLGWAGEGGSIYLSRRPSIFSYVSDNDGGISGLAYFSLILSICSIENKIRQLIFFSIIAGLFAILTNGRYVMIGYVLVALQFLIKQSPTKTIKYLIYFSLVVLIGYYIYTDLLGFNLKDLAQDRLFAEGDIRNTTRYLAYEVFLKYFPQNPFFGTGVHLTDEIKRVVNEGGSSQVHVGYLSHLISYGIVGSLLLFSFWFSLARDLYKKAKVTGFYGAFFAFIVFLWANVTFVEYNIFYPGVIVALVLSEYYYFTFLKTRFLKTADRVCYT